MMSDYSNNYTLAKDATKTVQLYHHEQVPFHSFSRQPIHTTNMASLNSPPMKQEIPVQNPASGDLQDIIYSYQSQPELLKLILLSKLEEDKRRAEEAKLKAKELDLLLIQQQQQQHQQQQQQQQQHQHQQQQHLLNTHSMNQNENHDLSSTNSMNTFQPQNLSTSDFAVHPTPPMSSNSSTDGRMFNNLRRTSLDAILSSPTQCTPFMPQQHRRDSTIGSSFNGSADSDELDDRTFSPIPTSATPVSTSSLLQMESFTMSSLNNNNKQHPLSPEYRLDEDAFHIPQSYSMEHRASITPTRYDFPSRPRRRREMQAITKIVETREYPYVDGYFWKNNGNTVQKKTGNKSVYYKCSNSNKGCPVNKTVTWKDNGEYLIKYRGEHLSDCNKVQRIVDV